MDDTSERSYRSELYQRRKERIDDEIGYLHKKKGGDEDEKTFARKARHTQFSGLLERMAKAAEVYAIERTMPPDDFASGILNDAIHVCESISVALVPDPDAPSPFLVWRHVNDLAQRLGHVEKLPGIDRDSLYYATDRYLKLPFRDEGIDRILADALIATEVIGYGHEMLRKPILYSSIKSPLQQPHILRQYLIALLSNLLLFGGAAAVLVWLGIKDIAGPWSLWTAFGLVCLFLLLAAVQTISLPFAWRRQSKVRKLAVDLLTSMVLTYDELRSAGPVSANRIHELATEGAKLGVMWPPPLFALLDDIRSRTGRL